MPQILKRLRLKFMLMTTGIVAVIVAIIAVGYCVSSYGSALSGIEFELEHTVNSSIGKNQPGKNPLDRPFDSSAPEGSQGTGENNPALENLDSDQRIDLFHGQKALVYTVVTDMEGTVLRTDSPALEISESILSSSIEKILTSEAFSWEDGAVSTGKLEDESLFYRAKVKDGSIYLGLTDSSTFEKQMTDVLLGALSLALVAIVLTVFISFFLARLFIRPVEESWNKQRRFIADASHELKTPLTVIMANTEIVRSNPEAKIGSETKWLDGVMDESKRMQGLIADLLLLAKMDDENVSAACISEENVNFSQAVEDTLFGFEAIAFERKLTVESSVQPDILIKGIHSRLSRLPDILMDNACKYAELGGIIKVNLKAVGDKAVLRVFNSGPEISKEDMTHLFDRFYRADESRCDDIPGYGLGLSIARSIVEESGGHITVENADNEGVTFVVTLPRSH